MKINKWKMALLVWSAMFPFSTLVSYGFSQLSFMDHWPLVARTFCLTCMLVPYMVFVALPFLTRRFHYWLQHQSSSKVESTVSQPIETTIKPIREQYAGLATNAAGAL